MLDNKTFTSVPPVILKFKYPKGRAPCKCDIP